MDKHQIFLQLLAWLCLNIGLLVTDQMVGGENHWGAYSPAPFLPRAGVLLPKATNPVQPPDNSPLQPLQVCGEEHLLTTGSPRIIHPSLFLSINIFKSLIKLMPITPFSCTMFPQNELR